MAAVVEGDAGEDDTHGHALSSNAAMRAVQEQFVVFAARDEARLRDMLAQSSDAAERALAAAMRDPNDGVRNNAMLALAVIAAHAAGEPQLGIHVPPEPFVDLLNSPFWTDRNKAVFTLVALSQTHDPALLTALRNRALTSLVEMARWKSRMHAVSFLRPKKDGSSGRTRTYNPPVNSRITIVLLGFAANCFGLPDGAYPKEG
jgi:hypothetical protein